MNFSLMILTVYAGEFSNVPHSVVSLYRSEFVASRPVVPTYSVLHDRDQGGMNPLQKSTRTTEVSLYKVYFEKARKTQLVIFLNLLVFSSSLTKS